jgi:hypothetical protein
MEPNSPINQPPTPRPFQTPSMNPTPSSGSGMKIVLAIIILALIGGGIYWYMMQDSAPEEVITQPTPTPAAATQAEVADLEREGDNIDLADIESDFGAEINSAVE